MFNSEELPEYLLGLFNDDHMDYHLQSKNQPTLEEMVEVAIKMLSRSKNGYFLFVEGELDCGKPLRCKHVRFFFLLCGLHGIKHMYTATDRANPGARVSKLPYGL